MVIQVQKMIGKQRMNKKIETALAREGSEFRRLKYGETQAVSALQSYRLGLEGRFKRRAQEFSSAASGDEGRVKVVRGKVVRAASELVGVFLEAYSASLDDLAEATPNMNQLAGFALMKKAFDDLSPFRAFDFDGAVTEISGIVRRGEKINYGVAGIFLDEMNVALAEVGSDLSKVIR